MIDENVLPSGFGEADPDFMADAYAEAKKTSGDDSKGKVVFLKTGVTHCRILPPHVNAPSWFREYKEHGLRPNGKFQTFTCPKALSGTECPVCEEGERLYAEKTEASILLAKDLYAKRAYLYNAYIYNSPESKGLKDGIVVIKSGVKVFKQLMEYDNDPAGDWGNISDLKSGIDFRIERKGQGRLGTEYSALPVPTRTNIFEKLAAEGYEIGEPTDLNSVYPAKTVEELLDAVQTHEPEDRS
jgi:hypothetical protein